jgi:hypothetical protein
MDLLERYLVSVGALVPANHRSDIVAELRSALISQFEDHQVQLGHPLTDEDIELQLKAYGHPVAVAASYRQQQPLIGPLLLPWYWLALRVTLGISWVVDLVISCIGVGSAGSLLQVLGHALRLAWSSAVMVTGTTTIVAVILDRLGAEKWLALWFSQIVASWRPRDLPQLPSPLRAPGPSWTITMDLIGIGLIILWMTGWADALTGPVAGITHVLPAAIVFALRWPILLIAVAQTALHIASASRPQPTATRSALSLALKAAMLVVLMILLRHWPWIQVVDLPASSPAATADAINLGVGIGLGIAWGVVALLSVVGMLSDIAQVRYRRK